MKVTQSDFHRCEKSSLPVWMTTIDGLEINVPGDAHAPFYWSVDYAARLIGMSEIYIQKSISILKEIASLNDEWIPDCLVVADDPNKQGAGFHIEFSNESDIYGLWWVEYKTLDERETGIIIRKQS